MKTRTTEHLKDIKDNFFNLDLSDVKSNFPKQALLHTQDWSKIEILHTDSSNNNKNK